MSDRDSFAERLGVTGAAVSSLEPKHPVARVALRAMIVALVITSLTLVVVREAGRLGTIDWRFEPAWLGLCLAALVAFELTHIELWRLQLRHLGAELPARRARAIWSVTLLARYVPTSALMAVGRVALSERAGLPKRVTLATIAYELAFTVIAALFVCAYLLWQLPALDDDSWVRWLAVGVPVVGLIALHPRIFHRVSDFVLVKMGRAKLPLSLPFVRVVELTVLYIGSFAVAGMAAWAMAQALHDIEGGDTYAAFASYAVGYVAGVIGFVIPGSLGAREAGIVLGLSVVVPATVAIAVAIALRLLQIGVELLYAAVMPMLARSAAGGR